MPAPSHTVFKCRNPFLTPMRAGCGLREWVEDVMCTARTDTHVVKLIVNFPDCRLNYSRGIGSGHYQQQQQHRAVANR